LVGLGLGVVHLEVVHLEVVHLEVVLLRVLVLEVLRSAPRLSMIAFRGGLLGVRSALD
jgi:hypothetical protein